MGFLTNLNKISKEIKGGWIVGQMSSSTKFTLFNSKLTEPSVLSDKSNHDGESLYFDKHDSYIILERVNGTTEKFKILEKISIENKTNSIVVYKTLRGSDIFSFSTKKDEFNTMNFVRVTSSDLTWVAYEGNLRQCENTH